MKESSFLTKFNLLNVSKIKMNSRVRFLKFCFKINKRLKVNKKLLSVFVIKMLKQKMKRVFCKKTSRLGYYKRRKSARIANMVENYILEELELLINSLKIKTKFHSIVISNFKICRIHFKYTGSNIYGTITRNNGEVVFAYSGGTFIDLNTRKTKTTIFVAKSLGELIAIRLYKTNAKEIFFLPLLKQEDRMRKLLRQMAEGFRLVRAFKITRVILKRRIIRNGVRLRKVPRK